MHPLWFLQPWRSLSPGRTRPLRRTPYPHRPRRGTASKRRHSPIVRWRRHLLRRRAASAVRLPRGFDPPAQDPTPLQLAIETSGFAAPDAYRRVVSQIDLVFQDLKHPDPVEHKRWTGVDPAPIHANLRWLKDSGRPFIARIPLIPGVNDTPEAKEGFARLLEGPSGLLRVELLPYHLTAAAKYPFTGRDYTPGFDVNRSLDTDLTPFRNHGLPAAVM